jgi:hypothetical protein
MSAGIQLKGTRFAARFMGSPRAWLVFAGVMIPTAAAWYLMAHRSGDGASTRGWFLWSGNLMVLLFLVTFLFSLRKWSLKFPFFRNFGRADPKKSDACWAEIQTLNNRVKAGAFADDGAILAEAKQLLARFRVDGALRAVLKEVPGGTGTIRTVDLVKKEPFGRLEPWLEVHLGVGTAACIGVFLHADFALRNPVGWALLVLSVVVLVAGVVGAWFFRSLPPKMAAADPGIPFEEAGVARGMLQECIEGIAAKLPPEAAGPLAALSTPAKTPEELLRRAEAILPDLTAKFPDRAALLRDLVVMAGTRDRLEWSTKRSRELEFQMRIWRWIHVPASIALVFVLGLHVVLILWY